MIRRWVAERLRYAADRLGPEDAFAAIGIRFFIRDGVGLVVAQDDGVQVSPKPPGARCWYRRSDYGRAFDDAS